jgi:translocation and assembly module TamA
MGKATLPASKFLYAGGSNGNRAYNDRDIGITTAPDAYDSLGGRTWLNFTAEIQYPIRGNFYGGVFFDATMISGELYDFSADWIQSAGIGVRYITPIGPLKIDFAANIHDPGANRISMMMGQSF